MEWPQGTPGSDRAVAAGCTCAVMDNGRGRGYLGGMKGEDGATLFVITQGCPLHGLSKGGDHAQQTDAAL